MQVRAFERYISLRETYAVVVETVKGSLNKTYCSVTENYSYIKYFSHFTLWVSTQNFGTYRIGEQ